MEAEPDWSALASTPPALRWILERQNSDGGWGDTDLSLSNISTTMLVRAAVHLAGQQERFAAPVRRAESYIAAQGGIEGLRNRYGKDKTFAVPILTNCALAGLVDWSEVSPLPFEMACLPQSWYRFARLPVVSYAIPALVAIGQARFHHLPQPLAAEFHFRRTLQGRRRVAITPTARNGPRVLLFVDDA